MGTRLEDLRLAADLRRSFRCAQVEMLRALAAGASGRSGATQTALADELGCPAPRISLLVREAVEAGLVDAVRAGDDRRQVRVRLTAEGSRRLARALSAQRRALRGVVRSLDTERVTVLLDTAARHYLGLAPTV